MSQLPLPMPLIPRNADSLLIGAPNETASAMLADWRRWPGPAAILTGPRRSGRSLLAARFAALTGGQVIDDADREDETLIFHAWNRAQADGTPLLLVAAAAPPIWQIGLADLRTRLATAIHAAILPPDEAFCEALISAGLVQGGSAFAPDVPAYLAVRLPRCYESIERVVDALNAVSLSTSRKISVALAKAELIGMGLLEDTDPPES